MKNELRTYRLVSAMPSLVLIAVIGCFTAARVEAAPQPSHQEILSGVGAVQTTVNGIDSKVNVVQTTVSGIGINVDDIKATLDQLPPAWSQILPAADRFKLVMGGAAVLDKETGLVWEQSPATTIQSWLVALYSCNAKAVGGRKGWRLPTLQELASLVDPTQSNPALPSGHPFSNVLSSDHWSATTYADDAGFAGIVDLFNGAVYVSVKPLKAYVWCVRGGQGVNPQ